MFVSVRFQVQDTYLSLQRHQLVILILDSKSLPSRFSKLSDHFYSIKFWSSRITLKISPEQAREIWLTAELGKSVIIWSTFAIPQSQRKRYRDIYLSSCSMSIVSNAPININRMCSTTLFLLELDYLKLLKGSSSLRLQFCQRLGQIHIKNVTIDLRSQKCKMLKSSPDNVEERRENIILLIGGLLSSSPSIWRR